MSQQSVTLYEKPQVLASAIDENQYEIGPGGIVIIIVAMSLVALIGAFAICIGAGYKGVAFQISIDNWSVKIGCYA
jgi:hypothetical protein